MRRRKRAPAPRRPARFMTAREEARFMIVFFPAVGAVLGVLIGAVDLILGRGEAFTALRIFFGGSVVFTLLALKVVCGMRFLPRSRNRSESRGLVVR